MQTVCVLFYFLLLCLPFFRHGACKWTMNAMNESMLFMIHNMMIVGSSASIFLASLPPRSMVWYCIDSCGNDVSTVMEFSRSHSQSPDASCQQMVKACGMHNIRHRVSNSPSTWSLADSCSKPTQMIGKVFTVILAWQVCKVWWLSCTIVFVVAIEVEDCHVQWCVRWLLLCGMQVLSSVSWAN